MVFNAHLRWPRHYNGKAVMVPHGESWFESIHVNVTVDSKLLGKLRSQLGVKLRREVAKGILQRQLQLNNGYDLRLSQKNSSVS